MISTEIHPADSAEFLSRLHDGDLEPAEAAAFESHRAECADCRASVAAFERALAAYREAPVPPASSDLSARILRKIRATSPSRRPFGVTFGIDVRWAGVLAAALLVLIIGAPVFSRHPFVRDSPGGAAAHRGLAPGGHLRLRGRRPGEAAGRRRARSRGAPRGRAPRRSPSPRRRRPARPRGRRRHGRSRPSRPRRPPPPREDAGARANAAGNVAQAAPESRRPIRAAPRSVPRRTRRACAPAADRAASSRPAARPASRGRSPRSVGVRLTIRAIDGEGTAPDLVRTPSDERLAALRGREFVLIVESGGRVRSVEERPEAEALEGRGRRRAGALGRGGSDGRPAGARLPARRPVAPRDRPRPVERAQATVSTAAPRTAPRLTRSRTSLASSSG